MAVTEADLKSYLRLPPDGESVARFLTAAQSKARSAGIPTFERNAQHDMFMLELAGMLYDNRGLTMSDVSSSYNQDAQKRLIDAYVLELRYATEDPIPGGDGE